MKDLYIARRKQLLENKKENTAVVIFSGSAPMKSQDASYPFAVDRNFYYLTGIDDFCKFVFHALILAEKCRKVNNYAESTMYIAESA